MSDFTLSISLASIGELLSRFHITAQGKVMFKSTTVNRVTPGGQRHRAPLLMNEIPTPHWTRLSIIVSTAVSTVFLECVYGVVTVQSKGNGGGVRNRTVRPNQNTDKTGICRGLQRRFGLTRHYFSLPNATFADGFTDSGWCLRSINPGIIR